MLSSTLIEMTRTDKLLPHLKQKTIFEITNATISDIRMYLRAFGAIRIDIKASIKAQCSFLT